MDAQALDWDAFFRRYRSMALRCAGAWADREGAEELLQEAARAVLERALREPPFETEAHARHYFFRALQNRAVDRLRASERRASSLDEQEEPGSSGGDPLLAASAAEEAALERQRLETIETLIEELRPEERLALRLRYGAGLTLREMSERTGTSLSTLGERVQAGLRKIRRRAGRPEGRSH